MKPAPEIYLEAVRRAGCAAGECFFADDKEENVDAAGRLGIDAVRFTDEKALQAELRERGVGW